MNIALCTLLLASFFTITNLSYAADRGATVPFKTYEAEVATRGGGAAVNSDKSINEVSSEKSYVHLKATGNFVEFTNLSTANRITLRYSIPKDVNGTISLYLNGVHNQDIALTSAQCYDSVDLTMPRRYSEVSIILVLAQGDLVKFQKDADDLCAWYGIDLIDIETAPDPLTMPSNYLSITDYGATGNDITDDTQAIKRCITAATSQVKGVWIPAGTFCQNTRITIPVNVNMMGAGIWYSTLNSTVVGTTYGDDIGYRLTSGSTISDIKFTGVAVARSLAAHLFRPVGKNETLKNLWIMNVGCIYGWSDKDAETSFNVLKDSRVIGTYFDGVHWGDGNSHNNLVENTYFRGMGDDAVAQVNRADKALCYDNVAKFNSIIASYWGRGLANIGGDNLIYTDNYISSCYLAGLMIATEPLGESVSAPINGFQFLRNTIHKCGHFGHNHAGIHFWLYTSSMMDVVIKDNIIEYGETEGIHIDNTDFGDEYGRTLFENNIVRFNYGSGYNNSSNEIKPILTNNNGIITKYTSTINQLDQPDGHSMILIPNPVKNQLNIQSSSEFDTILIYDSTGSKVYSQNLDKGSTNEKINLSNLNPGTYTVEIRHDNIRTARKMMKL